MSRSYHMTGKAAGRLLREGDTAGQDELTEKKAVKESVAKYRSNYRETLKSSRDTPLRNSHVVRSAKAVLNPKEEE